MKRSLVLICILSVFFSIRAFAALGNNENEIENFFGPPVRKGAPDKRGITTNLYQKGNYVILVQFLNHLSLAESYTRADQQEFSQKEIDAFLDGSSNGRPWTKVPNKETWERGDHKAKAWTTKVGDRPTLLIQAD
jgi:hypothetical protein